MRSITFGPLLVSTLLLPAATSAATDGPDAWKAKLLAEGPPAWAALAERWEAVRVEYRMAQTVVSPSLPEPRVTETRGALLRDAGGLLYLNVVPGEPAAATVALGTNPDYGFHLRRPSAGAGWEVKSLALSREAVSGAVLQLADVAYLTPFSLNGLPLPGLMDDPGITWGDVEHAPDADDRTLTVRFVLNRDGPPGGIDGGTFTFEPDHGWRVREATGEMTGGTLRQSTEYRGDGPAPASAVVAIESPRGSVITRTRFPTFEFAPDADPAAFRVAAFGLEDPVPLPGGFRAGRWPWVVGAACVAAAAVLYLLRRRPAARRA